MHKILLSVVLLALAMPFTPSLMAQGKGYGKSFVERMGITEAQAEQLGALKSLRRANRKSENEIYLRLNEVINSADYSVAEVESLAGQLGALVSANAIAEAATVHDFYLQLTNEQKVMWEEHETRNNKRLRGARNQRQEKQQNKPEGEN